MSGFWKTLTITVVALALLGGLLVWDNRPTTSAEQLTFYCAAGLRKPVERIAADYEREFGVRIQLQYAGSGTLLNNLQVAQQGDLYLAADISYIEIAREKGLVAESIPIAVLTPVLVVPRGNPKGIRGIGDVLADDIRISLANPDAASVGKVTKKLLEASGHWNSVSAAVQDRGVFKPTVNEVANDVKLGAVDAGIVWNATANQYPELEAVPLPNGDEFRKEATVGVLTYSEHPTAALQFARYLGARDRGLVVFEEEGFPIVEGDAWAWRPEILYFSGGVNRVAIEETLSAFSKREGVRINTVYNGCGILLGSIKLGERPDLYHTCDISFMTGVESLFDDAELISKTDIVILVPKGNPKKIESLADLSKGPLRLGLCNEEQSTLGAMTAVLLKEQGLYDKVTQHVVVMTPTADLLVGQLVVGQLDAAIVYLANTKFVSDKADVIPIPLPKAVAVQSVAVAQETEYPRLLARLQEALRTAPSRKRFMESGFDWLPPEIP